MDNKATQISMDIPAAERLRGIHAQQAAAKAAREAVIADRLVADAKLKEEREAEIAKAKAARIEADKAASVKRMPTQIQMPDTDASNEASAIRLGTLTIQRADDGGFFNHSRRKLVVITADDELIENAQDALQAVYAELVRLSAKAKK
jgi:hypothetical protein